MKEIFSWLPDRLAKYAHDSLLEMSDGSFAFIDGKTIDPLNKKRTGNVCVSDSTVSAWLEITELTGIPLLVPTEDGRMDDSDWVIMKLVGKEYDLLVNGADPLSSSSPFWTYETALSRDRWR